MRFVTLIINKMKKLTILTIAILSIVSISCGEKQDQEKLEVKKADDKMMHAAHGLDVKVDNKFDPICGMETAGHVSDTINYQGKVYGFCNPGCKEEFAKNPEQYLSKLNPEH